jgi:cation diffusion facilitator family transporter
MNRFETTRRVALLGIIANVELFIIKLIIGLMSRSQAMIADSFNSAGDVITSVATFIGNNIASRPVDEDHPYGHGKAEYIFSMIISFFLLIVAYKIFRNSLNSIFSKQEFIFSWWLVGIAIVTIISKLLLFFYTRKAGRRENSLLIIANSQDHRNDVFVTSSTLLGITFGSFGLYWFDGAVGVGISLWIAFTGVKIFMSSYYVLMDTSIDNVLKKQLIKSIETINGVDHVDSITSKPIGVRFIVIVKVSVPGNMHVIEGHSIAAKIKKKLKEESKHVGDVVVHVNPS